MFSKGYQSEGRVACWHALKKLPRKKKFHWVVAVPPPPPPEDPKADDEEEEAEPEPEQYQPEPEQLPPPPPNLVDVMALQTQLMQRMAEALEHRGNGGIHNAPPGEELTKKSRRSSA
jgi:hypothetical protein